MQRIDGDIQQLVSRLAYRLRRSARPLGQAALELVWPTRCACCERLGVLLCPSCADALPRIDRALACPRCGAPHGKLVCTECTPAYEPVSFAFEQTCCALEFSQLTRRLIVAYKDGGERRLAPVLAWIVASAIPLEWRRWADALTWIPADSEALRRRGFDHMALIALALAEQSGLRAVPLLSKRAREDQRSLGRKQRQQNTGAIFTLSDEARELVGAPAPRAQPAPAARAMANTPAAGPGVAGVAATALGGASPHALRRGHVLLIDDVLTTGATLDAAARTLRLAGIGAVRVATVARVW
jgi:predicted amidophosphoribosyltransferase